MTWWVLPTTADIGIRAFATDVEGALSDAALGLQSIQLNGESDIDQSDLETSEDVWEIEFPDGDLERGLVRWLEEVLYRGSEEGQWMVGSEITLGQGVISARVNWIDSGKFEPGLEVKAITMHELALKEIAEGEIVVGINPEIPTFEGPGWMAQAILDI